MSGPFGLPTVTEPTIGDETDATFRGTICDPAVPVGPESGPGAGQAGMRPHWLAVGLNRCLEAVVRPPIGNSPVAASAPRSFQQPAWRGNRQRRPPLAHGDSEVEIRPAFEMDDCGAEVTPHLRASEYRRREATERRTDAAKPWASTPHALALSSTAAATMRLSSNWIDQAPKPG